MTSLEQHLAAHALYYDEDSADCNVCGCGWKIDGEILDYHGDTTTQIAELHATHVAATWCEARTVRTVEELEALPALTIIREGIGSDGLTKAPSGVWRCDDDLTPFMASSITLPALIVWTPEEGAL